MRILLGAILCLATASYSHETPDLLPKGVSRFRVVGVMTQGIENSFNSTGEVEGITRSLNRSVSVKDFVASNPDLERLVDTLNVLDPSLGEELLAANIYSDFKVNANIILPAYEYGITSEINVGIRLPYVMRTVSHQFKVDGVNNAQYTLSELGEIPEQLAGGLDTVSNIQLDDEFFKQQLFAAKGYQVPSNFERNHVGDLEFGGKFQYAKTEIFKGAITAGLRAPTGTAPALDNPFDTGTGTGAWAAGLKFDQAIWAVGKWRIGAMGKAWYHFPDTRQRAVPLDANDTLPSLLPEDGQVQAVRRFQPMKFESELWTSYELFGDVLELWTAYQFSAKGQDEFTGPGDLYYEGLSEGTNTSLQTAQFGFGISTIPLYRKKAFPLPMQLAAFYSVPVTGTNTTLSSYGRMDLKLYF